MSLTFSARVGEEGKLFGSVTATDIAQQLEAQGFHIEKRQIDLHEPIKALGVYRVPIRLHADVKPEVRVWVIKQYRLDSRTGSSGTGTKPERRGDCHAVSR